MRSLQKRLGLFAIALFLSVFMAVGCTSVSHFLAAQDGVKTAIVPASASEVRSSKIPLGLGTNLAGIADWSSQIPFLDLMKSSRAWITQCNDDDPGCNDAWDTQEFDRLDLDEQGWVKSLPAPEDSPRFTKVSTFLFNGLERYPYDQYVVLYEGEGKLEYGFDAKQDEAASQPGRDVINVAHGSGAVLLTVRETDPNRSGNYIRNIHVVPIAYEQTFRQQIFNPQFLERTRKFNALRFMDWMQTNNSEQKEWSDRPQVEDATYAIQGVPLEIMVELANQLQANPWFNIPHQATDEYITSFARLVKERLDPQLKVYVEYSNEVWNWQFRQAHYALEQGQTRWGKDKGDAYTQWYGMRAAQMSDLWKREFGDEGDRVIPIIATQEAWQGLEEGILNCPYWVAEGNRPCYQHGFTAYATAGYFSGDLGNPEKISTVESWLREPDGGIGKAFEQLGMNGTNGNSVGDAAKSFEYHANVANRYGLNLVAYEGGQHLTGREGIENNEAIVNFFTALNRHPRMGECYTELLNQWKAAGGTLFMHFSDIGQPGKWGAWGALESVLQTRSPKYDALIDFIDQNQLRK
ncbi:hypothetical protein [Leptolyngbya ohadii]|uniref:hypothetical protein n=1 Tax=Leptolyngbya ohadii TaxID=1962290 RepID=UPI0019D4BD63|nr:hypothetical protein [Leptolyngbya ohadii]